MTAANGADLFAEAVIEAIADVATRGRLTGIECPHCRGTGKVAPRTMGERLRALRAATGLLQEQVSDKLTGVISAANLGHIECDRNTNPRLEVVRALAEFYGVRPGWLIDGDPEE